MEDKYPIGSVFRQVVNGKEIEGVAVHSRNESSWDVCIIWNTFHDFYKAAMYYPDHFIDAQIEQKYWTQVR